MTDWDRLQEAISFVNDHGIDVEYKGIASKMNPEFPFNGCAFLESGIIDLYADNPKKQADELISVLIHEFGHIMDWRLYGGGDSESAAWKVGIRKFPKYLLPKSLSRVKKKSLAYYTGKSV